MVVQNSFLTKDMFIVEFSGALAPLKKWTFTYFVKHIKECFVTILKSLAK